jgi:hypothetical protein
VTACCDLNIALALAGPHTLYAGLVWWTFELLLATIGFFATGLRASPFLMPAFAYSSISVAAYNRFGKALLA